MGLFYTHYFWLFCSLNVRIYDTPTVHCRNTLTIAISFFLEHLLINFTVKGPDLRYNNKDETFNALKYPERDHDRELSKLFFTHVTSAPLIIRI